MATALSPYTLAQLETDIQYLTGDVEGTRFSSALLADAANYAIKRIVTMKGYTYKEACIEGTVQTGPNSITLIPLNGTYVIDAGYFVVGQTYTIVSTGTTDFTAVGAADSTPGTVFVATGIGSGTGTASTVYDYRDYIEIRRVLSGGSVNSITSSSVYELLTTGNAQEDMKNPTWRTDQGTPRRWTLYDGNNIVLIKPPAVGNEAITLDPSTGKTLGTATGYIITVGYVQQPLLLVDPTDSVDARVPLPMHQYLKYAGSSWLLSLDQTDTASLNTAKLYMDTFMNLVGA